MILTNTPSLHTPDIKQLLSITSRAPWSHQHIAKQCHHTICVTDKATSTVRCLSIMCVSPLSNTSLINIQKCQSISRWFYPLNWDITIEINESYPKQRTIFMMAYGFLYRSNVVVCFLPLKLCYTSSNNLGTTCGT